VRAIARPFDPSQRFAKLLVSGGIVGIATDIVDTIEKPARDFIIDFVDCKVAQSSFQLGTKCLLGPVRPRYAGNRKASGSRRRASRL
jgi:hypothetical protein